MIPPDRYPYNTGPHSVSSYNNQNQDPWDYTRYPQLYRSYDWVGWWSHILTKPVFWVMRHSTIQTDLLCYRDKLDSWNLGFSKYLYYLGSEHQWRWTDCTVAQADLPLCCLHVDKTCFLRTRLIYSVVMEIYVNPVIIGFYTSNFSNCHVDITLLPNMIIYGLANIYLSDNIL